MIQATKVTKDQATKVTKDQATKDTKVLATSTKVFGLFTSIDLPRGEF